jgi:sugar lactone lactonase YvrE
MKPILLVFVCLLSLSVKSQIITTFAGNGTASGISGDGGQATAASINGANGGVFDENGNYFIAEINGHRIRKVTPNGIISSIAGNNIGGFSSDGIAATLAKLNTPTSVQIDKEGNLYIVDANNYRIRKVESLSGNISTIAGTGVSGYNGDNIPATNAQISVSEDLCFDKVGNIYISDKDNFRVRKIDTFGIITTVAGNGGFSATGTGDGGAATNATFNWIAGLVVDNDGNIYIADFNAGKIRKVDAVTGIITTIAGNGNYVYVGDNIPATNAQINPIRLTFDRSNNLVIADKYNRRILRIDDDGIIHTIAGNGMSGYSGDGGPATAASFNFPAGVVYDTCGNLYIAESTNRRVRKVSFNPSCLPLGVQDMSINNVGEVLIYPNPASGEITVECSGVTKVALCNVLGQVVYEQTYKKADKVMVDISHHPPGIYMVRVNDVWVGKVVKE